MKALMVGAGVGLVLGGAAYAQYSLNDLVEQELSRLSDSQRLSQRLGTPVVVDVLERDHGYLKSSGRLDIRGEYSQQAFNTVVDYTIDHNVIGGVRYNVVLPTLTVGEDDPFSVNDELFQSQPVRLVGEMDATGSDGHMLVPAVNATDDNGVAVLIDAFPVNIAAHGFETNALIGDYVVDAKIPQIQLRKPNSRVMIENVTWAQSYLGNQEVTKADFSLVVGHVESEGETMSSRFQLDNATVRMDTDISAQVSGDMEVTLASVVSAMGTLSDVSIKTRIGGLDGPIMKDMLLQIDQLEQSADPDVMMTELSGYFSHHVDALVAPSPYFQIEQLQFDMNGQRFVDASGKVTLQSDKLPDGYFGQLLEQEAVPDTQTLLFAVDASLDTSFGPQAAMMIGPLHPMLMAVLQTGEPISLRVNNGQMMLNGQPL